MPQYFDTQGGLLRLGTEINRGGEGIVFEIADDSKLVAKIYHKAAPTQKADKLRCMVKLASPELVKFASWPLKLLHNGQVNEVAGVVMPRVNDHEEIHTLYSPAQRKTDYPDKDWHFLVHTARNCAIAFDAIHRRPLVIGDVNPGNLLVAKGGTVFLIDCDSFQVNSEDKLFLCDVGVREFTPPELQSHDFHGVQRTHNHDCFGLALMIFHLLFMGRHPFAGRFLGAGDMPIERAIQEFRFAFSPNAVALQMARPPQTLSLDQVAPEVTDLFERAFTRGSERPGARPSARDWCSALETLLQGLQTCRIDRGHKFSGKLAKCPWCELMQVGAPNFFLSVTVRVTNANILDVNSTLRALWNAIESVARPVGVPVANVLQLSVRIVPTPPPPDLESAQSLTMMVRAVAIGSLLASMLAIILPFLAVVGVPIFVVFGIWWLVLFLYSGERGERSRRKYTLRQARARLRQLQTLWDARIARSISQFDAMQKDLSTVRNQLASIKNQHDKELGKLQGNAEIRQREAFLQKALVRNASIEGIGAGRKTTLNSYGIETAFDVAYSRILEIPGFGPNLASSLVAWRSVVESRFRFDAAKGVPIADRQSLLYKICSDSPTARSPPQEWRRTVEGDPPRTAKVITAAIRTSP